MTTKKVVSAAGYWMTMPTRRWALVMSGAVGKVLVGRVTCWKLMLDLHGAV